MVVPSQWQVELFSRPAGFCRAHAPGARPLGSRRRPAVAHDRPLAPGQPLMPQMLRLLGQQPVALPAGQDLRDRLRHARHQRPAGAGPLLDWPGSRVLLTGQADEQVAVKAFNSGLIDQFVPKQAPTSPATCSACCATVTSRRTPGSTAVAGRPAAAPSSPCCRCLRWRRRCRPTPTTLGRARGAGRPVWLAGAHRHGAATGCSWNPPPAWATWPNWPPRPAWVLTWCGPSKTAGQLAAHRTAPATGLRGPVRTAPSHSHGDGTADLLGAAQLCAGRGSPATAHLPLQPLSGCPGATPHSGRVEPCGHARGAQSASPTASPAARFRRPPLSRWSSSASVSAACKVRRTMVRLRLVAGAQNTAPKTPRSPVHREDHGVRLGAGLQRNDLLGALVDGIPHVQKRAYAGGYGLQALALQVAAADHLQRGVQAAIS
jgi:hypothetical protein